MNGKRLTNNEFDLKIKDSNFIRITDYLNCNTSIVFECKRCKKKYRKKPKNFNRLNCKCIINGEKYILHIRNKNIELVDNYVNIRKKINHKCLVCGLIFLSSPKSIKDSIVGCPSCSGKKFSIDKYKSLLNKNIKLESNFYDGSNKKLEHKCMICDHTWNTLPNYIIHMGCGCPNCNSSKGENIISDILDSLHINYKREYSIEIDNIKYRFDFFIEEFNLFIEYDGIQHFKPIEYFGGTYSYNKIIINDEIKNKWCINNKYKLLRISYIDNIENTLNKYFNET